MNQVEFSSCSLLRVRGQARDDCHWLNNKAGPGGRQGWGIWGKSLSLEETSPSVNSTDTSETFNTCKTGECNCFMLHFQLTFDTNCSSTAVCLVRSKCSPSVQDLSANCSSMLHLDVIHYTAVICSFINISSGKSFRNLENLFPGNSFGNEASIQIWFKSNI